MFLGQTLIKVVSNRKKQVVKFVEKRNFILRYEFKYNHKQNI